MKSPMSTIGRLRVDLREARHAVDLNALVGLPRSDVGAAHADTLTEVDGYTKKCSDVRARPGEPPRPVPT